MRTWQVRGICIVVLLILLLGARAIQSLAVPSNAPASMSKVAIVRASGDVDGAVRQAVAQAGGLAGVIEPGDLVVIKVNLVLDAPAGSGMVTGPAVARAVVRLAREAGAAQVIIAEGTAQYREGDANRDRLCTQAAFRTAGYDTDGDMVDDATGAPLADLNETGGTDVADPARVTKVIVPTGLIRKEYWLPNVVLDADVLISVPVLKNHYLAGVTLGMKNLIGLLPNDLYHGPGNIYGKHSLSHGPIELDQHIVDLSLARRPDFVVVDGQRGMTDGPIGSQVIAPPMDLILAGRDVVAVDTVGALAMGYDPRTIPYLSLAAQSGLGTTNTSHIRVVGIPLSQVRRDFPAPYADSPAQRADAQPPAVSLASPGQEAWQGGVTVLVEASDNDAVGRVELHVDGKRVGQVLGPPYEFTIDTGQYSPGVHTIRAVAYDRCLNQSESVRQVQFAGPTATSTATPVPPTDTATSPPPTSSPVAPTSTPLPTKPPTSTPTAPLPETETPIPPTVTPTPGGVETSTAPAPTTAAVETASSTPTAESVALSPPEGAGPPVVAASDTDQPSVQDGLLLLSLAIITLLAVGLLGLGLGLLAYMRRRQ